MTKLNREEVYKIIDDERDHQDKKFGGCVHDNNNSISDWLIYIRIYLTDAENAVYKSNPDEAMEAVRKIVGMGVAAIEAKGCPKRNK